LKTLLNFNIAILVFLAVNLILGIHYSGWEIVGSFIGLTSIGNSNWYIFSILVMYVISYLAGVVFKDNYKGIAITVTICSVLYVIIIQIIGLPSRFVSTIVTYAFGMWLCLFKNEIKNVFKGKPVISLVFILIPILATFNFRANDYIMNISSCFFVLLVVWFMTHFEIKSKILYSLGKYSFSIYVLQRLPMNTISYFYSPSGLMNYMFVASCLFITVGLSIIFDKLVEQVDKKIIKT